jgi:hypothetical protein
MHEQLDKVKLLDQMRGEFAFVQRTLLLIPENLLDTPGADGDWSVHDALAHLVAWQQLARDWITAAKQGEQPAMPAPGYDWSEIDKLNGDMHARDKDRPLADLLTEFRSSYEQLYALTETLSENELFGRAGVSTFFRDPVWETIAGNTYQHYEEHVTRIRRWLRQIVKFQTAEGEAVEQPPIDPQG